MKINPTFHARLYARCMQDVKYAFSCSPTFRYCRSDRVRDSVYIVSPGTSFAILAVASFAVFAVSVEIRSSCTPTTVLDSEYNHFPLPSHLVALVDSICSSTVASTDSRVGTFDLGYSTTGSVLPASEMGVCWKK